MAAGRVKDNVPLQRFAQTHRQAFRYFFALLYKGFPANYFYINELYRF